MNGEEGETNRAKAKDRYCSKRAEMRREEGREGQRKKEMGRAEGQKIVQIFGPR